MTSNEPKKLYITGNEEFVLIENLIKDELYLEPMKQELMILRLATLLYKRPNQWFHIPRELFGTPNEQDMLKKIAEAFGDKLNSTYRIEYCSEGYRMMIINQTTSKHSTFPTHHIQQI